ncbi:hypothetical protein CBL_13058 [Carabus blaptoides fortunei]
MKLSCADGRRGVAEPREDTERFLTLLLHFHHLPIGLWLGSVVVTEEDIPSWLYQPVCLPPSCLNQSLHLITHSSRSYQSNQHSAIVPGFDGSPVAEMWQN